MLIYILIFFFLFFASFFLKSYSVDFVPNDAVKKGLGSRESRTICVLAFAVLTLVMGCRSMLVGADTYQYYLKYLQYDINGENTEFLYQFVNDLFSNLGVPWQVYLLVISAFVSYAVIRFIYEYSPDPAFSILLYMTIGLFSLNMSGIRQSIAIAICLLGFIEFNRRNKILLFIIAIGVAFLFHNSAIVMIAIIPLSCLSRKKWFTTACVSAIVLTFPFRESVASFLYLFAPERYQSNFYDINAGYNMNLLAFGLQVAPVVFYLICTFLSTDAEKKYGARQNEERAILAMSLVSLFLYVLSFNSASIGRLAFYFQMANSVIIPVTVARIPSSRMRFLLRLSISCLAVVAFLISVPGGSSHIDNYSFYFE